MFLIKAKFLARVNGAKLAHASGLDLLFTVSRHP